MIDTVLIIIVFMYNIGSIVFIYCNHHQKQQQTLLFKVPKKVKVERKMASNKVDVDPLYCPPS